MELASILQILVPIVLFFTLMFLGMPVAFAMAISGIIGLIWIIGFGPALGIIQTVPFREVASYTLTTIPMFILMAEFAAQSGIIYSIFRLAEALLVKIRGGLAIAVVFASSILATLTGSSVGAAGAMAKLAIPEMDRLNYKSTFSLGVVSIAGTLAVMIPPSIPLVIYGIITETSIGKLLLAGIIPGILTAVGYVVTILVWSKVRPDDMPKITQQFSAKRVMESTLHSWPFLLIMFVVLGGLYMGVVTATEAAAFGALSVFIVWMLLSLFQENVQMKGQDILTSLDNTIKTTIMILFLIIGAYFFGYFLTVTGVTQYITDYIANLPLPRHVILILILFLLLVLGFFLSQIEILVLTMPLLFPVIMELNFDPVWFGILVTKMVEIGLVTPPVGMNVYVVTGSVKNKRPEEAFIGVVPFLIAEVIIIALLILFPDLVLLIPNYSQQ